VQNQITCALGVFAGLLRRRFLAVTLFLCGVQAFFYAHVSLLGKCMPHEHPHDRRSAFLDSGSNVWAERIHCCIKGVCTAAVVAFLRLRRVFVSGVRPLAVSRHMCALELLPAAAVVRFFWHAGSSACTNDNICAFGCL
jgi:hypothetical protein